MVLAPHTPGPAWHCRARGWVSSQPRAGSFLGFTPTFGQTCSNQTLPSCRARWKPCVCHLTPASSRALLPLGFLLIEPKSCLPAARLGPHPALCSAACAGGAGRTGPPAHHHQHHHPGKEPYKPLCGCFLPIIRSTVSLISVAVNQKLNRHQELSWEVSPCPSRWGQEVTPHQGQGCSCHLRVPGAGWLCSSSSHRE